MVPEVDVAHLFRPAFPSEVPLQSTLHNLLRLATVHLSQTALRAVLAELRSFPAFPDAYAAMVASDVWQRRELVAGQARHDGAWFVERFRIGPLA